MTVLGIVSRSISKRHARIVGATGRDDRAGAIHATRVGSDRTGWRTVPHSPASHARTADRRRLSPSNHAPRRVAIQKSNSGHETKDDPRLQIDAETRIVGKIRRALFRVQDMRQRDRDVNEREHRDRGQPEASPTPPAEEPAAEDLSQPDIVPSGVEEPTHQTGMPEHRPRPQRQTTREKRQRQGVHPGCKSSMRISAISPSGRSPPGTLAECPSRARPKHEPGREEDQHRHDKDNDDDPPQSTALETERAERGRARHALTPRDGEQTHQTQGAFEPPQRSGIAGSRGQCSSRQ